MRSRSPTIGILGAGPAATIAASVFRRVGLSASTINEPAPLDARLVILNQPTLMLIDDLFGAGTVARMAAAGQTIKRRVVGWTDGAAVPVDEQALIVPLSAFATLEPGDAAFPRSQSVPDLIVEAYGRRANGGEVAGARFAFVWRLQDTVLSERDSCFIQAVTGGWVFVASAPDGGLMIQVVAPSDNVDEARAILARALALLPLEIMADEALSLTPFRFDAAPRLAPDHTEGRAAIGDQAIAFDPVSGDGIGHILRAAVLLGALLKDDHSYASSTRMLFRSRLRKSFIAHLETCECYYSQIVDRESWSSIVWAMRRNRLALQLLCDREPFRPYCLDRTDIIWPSHQQNLHLEEA